MENYFSFIIFNFIIDYLLCYTLKTIFKLQIKKLPLLFLQILHTCNCVIYLFFELKSFEFLMIKFLIMIIVCLLITDSYKFSKLFSLIMISLLLMFSYYGFSVFIIELIKAVANEVFNVKISKIASIITLFFIILYIFAVFRVVNHLTKKKIIKNFIKKVSFFAFGKHIEFNGLIDSGNALYDSKTKLPVVLVSVLSLKNYLSQNIYENITKNNFCNLSCDHYLKVCFASGVVSEIPIFKIQNIKICGENGCSSFRCVIAIVNHKFENDNAYDCLLHRDFV